MFDAIVLAGGTSRRLGGADKMALEVGGQPLLDHVLHAVAGAGRLVVVGPARPVPVSVRWCQEDPPGGGPVAGIVAGLSEVRADVVLIVAGDLPWIGGAVPALLEAQQDSGADAAVLVDADGRPNHLAAAWRTAALRQALAALPNPAGAAARTLYATAPITAVPDRSGWGQDCDTPDQLAAALARAAGSSETDRTDLGRNSSVTNPLDAWVAELCDHLGVPPDHVDRNLLLDVARDAAHGVARPAAPLTTFVVGLAAGRNGGTPEAIRDAAATAQRLALAHQSDGASADQRTDDSPA